MKEQPNYGDACLRGETVMESRFPFTLARPEVLNYDPSQFPQTLAALESILVLP
jgi:hypothetical protein